MTKLPRITMIAADCYFYGEAIAAIKKSLTKISPSKTIFFTDIDAYSKSFPFELIKIKKLNSKRDYSEFIIKQLDQYIETDFVLVMQHDGWVLDDSAWSEEFLEYDYIGAPWLEVDGYNVGNGGFSLRSKKLQHILATDDFIKINHSAEDVIICRLYRSYLEEKYGIKFAPEEVAERFSYELVEPTQSTFGFHGKFHEKFKPTVIVKRDGACGDIIMSEPLLDELHKLGNNVVVDMPVHLCMFFGFHFFPIKHISQVDERILKHARVIDLNDSYEATPKKLHLEAYYEKAGINGEIKNPKLKFVIDSSNKLFNKYCVIHIDERQNYRNIYGIKWGEIVSFLKERGYIVIQVGQREHEVIEGAIEMTTITTQFLLWVIAGADMFMGVDSAPSNIAVSCDVPSVIFFGSVNPDYIYPNLENVCVIHRHQERVCSLPFCWHEVVNGKEGQDCVVDSEKPPCTQFNHTHVFDKIKLFMEEKNIL